VSDPAGAEYGDVSTEAATLTVLPLTLDVSGVSTSEDVVVRGETFSASATVEASGMGNLVTTRDVELRVDVDGNGNLESDETVATVTQQISAGGTVGVTFANVQMPAGVLLGEVTVGVVAGDASDTTTVTVSVPPLADGMAPPLDPDGDGVYEDTNGNGDVTLTDVTALFDNRDSTTVTENPSLFDFNVNGAFNVADIQTLFAELTEAMSP
jgi:PKD repeat protein